MAFGICNTHSYTFMVLLIFVMENLCHLFSQCHEWFELKIISDITSVLNLVLCYVWHMRENLPLKVWWHQLKNKNEKKYEMG